MRANDAQKLLPYNLFEFSILHECLSVASGMNLGNFYYSAGTIHLRGEKDIENNINPWGSAKTIQMLPMQSFDKDTLKDILLTEEKIRKNIPNLSNDSYISFVDSIISSSNGYWLEFYLILCDYGYNAFHQENPPEYPSTQNLNIYRTYLKNKK